MAVGVRVGGGVTVRAGTDVAAARGVTVTTEAMVLVDGEGVVAAGESEHAPQSSTISAHVSSMVPRERFTNVRKFIHFPNGNRVQLSRSAYHALVGSL